MYKYQKAESQLHVMLNDFVDNGQLPALSVGIVKDNHTIFTGEYGTANIAISVMTNCDYVWLGSVSNPILDLMLGSNIHQIKRSMAHKIADLSISDGVEKAMEEYHRINRMEQDKYHLVDFKFMRITEALTWNGHKEDALRILTCAAAIFPDSEPISSRLQELQANA